MSLHLTKQLKRTIQDDPSKCVLLIGSGLSASGVRLEGKGIPNWDTLVQHMIDDLRDSENCDKGILIKLEESFKAGKHLQIAQVFKQRTRPDQFAAFLRSELDPPDIITSSKIHELILKINFRGIITTNFDMVFEYQSNRLQPLNYPQCLDDIASFRKHGFFAKIHGCIRNTSNPTENLILTEESYTTLKTNTKYHTILRSIFLMHPILTVGFSLRDPDFLGLIDDLRVILGESMPTIYGLMCETENSVRDVWRKKGVEIIPYENHGELLRFFEEMLTLSEQKHPIPMVIPTSKVSEINYEALLEKWQRVQKVEEMHKIIQEQIDSLPNSEQRENFIFQFLALVSRRDKIRLTPYLTTIGTASSERVLFSIFKNIEGNQRWQTLNNWQVLNPHTKHICVYKWVLKNWPKFVINTREACFTWLLHKDWVEHGIDLWETFLSLLNRVLSTRRQYELSELYEVSQHIEGATERIEKLIFSPDFVREDNPKRRWFKSWDIQTRESVRFERFKNGSRLTRGCL